MMNLEVTDAMLKELQSSVCSSSNMESESAESTPTRSKRVVYDGTFGPESEKNEP